MLHRHLIEVDGEFFVMTLVDHKNELVGVWACKDADALNVNIIQIIHFQLTEAEVLNPHNKKTQQLVEMCEAAKTRDDVTLTRIAFENETRYEFDISGQRLFKVGDGVDAMKEATDEGRADAQGREQS